MPAYRTGKHGDWEIIVSNPPLIRGYYNGLVVPENDNYVLVRSGKVWMSLTPMELESQAMHAFYARGTVVVAGLGMGMLLYNIARKPEVKHVVVIEKDPDVIELFKWSTDYEQWDCAEKITIYCKEAERAWVLGRPDYLAIDIFPTLGDSTLRSKTKQVLENCPAERVVSWGMELDYMSWCADEDLPHRLAKEDDCFRAYAEDCGIPWVQFDGIARYCFDCAANTALA